MGFLHEPDGHEPSIERARRRVQDADGIYGEVSHFWKDRVDELVAAFPNACFTLLVRNGRKVVSSFLHRPHYRTHGVQHAYQREILPVKGFRDMDRFEKLCWYWTFWNLRLYAELIAASAPVRVVRIEDVHARKRENRGPQHAPWGRREEQTFRRVCLQAQKAFGYE